MPAKMKTSPKPFIASMLAALSLGAAAAQSGAPAAPSSERYEFRSVAIGGGGFVTGIIFNPSEKGLVYARTDVGGAYRRDARSR